MKKIFLFLVATLFAVNAFAQLEQGSLRIGGTSELGFLNLKPKGADYSTNSLTLGVDGGYFFMDNFSVDAALLFDYEKDSDEDDALTTFGVEVGVRYYLPVKVFFGAGFDLVTSKYGDNDSVSGTGLNLKVGYAAFLSDKIALEPSVGYRLGLSDEEKGTQANGFGVQLGISVFF